ncbi:MAG TPA: hypothetical protein VHP14_04570 [Anaerolineales bacterium]|nr:hypothetical protein [Anaerolineales bacterium]
MMNVPGLHVRGFQDFAWDVVVTGLHIIVSVPQHVGDMGSSHCQVTGFIMRRKAAVPDEVMHSLCYSCSEPARVFVQFGL